jgi:hypothetical protein
VAVLGTTVPRASNLQCFAKLWKFKRCVCPLYKFVSTLKVVKLLLQHPVHVASQLSLKRLISCHANSSHLLLHYTLYDRLYCRGARCFWGCVYPGPAAPRTSHRYWGQMTPCKCYGYAQCPGTTACLRTPSSMSSGNNLLAKTINNFEACIYNLSALSSALARKCIQSHRDSTFRQQYRIRYHKVFIKLV